MRALFSFFRMRLLSGLQYRTAALAGVFTQFFWGFMEICLYRAFYAEHAEAFPMSFQALVSYLWLRQALLALYNTWTFEGELFESVIKGDVAYELIRPVSLYAMWFARTAALRISRAALRALPILAVAFLLPAPWRMGLPASWPLFIAYLASTILSTIVMVGYALIVYFSCFYTVSAEGLRTFLTPVVDLLGGGVVPYPFMPDALRRALELSPFGAMQNAPLRIYAGDLAGGAALHTLSLQLFWAVALNAFAILLLKHGLRRVTVQGG